MNALLRTVSLFSPAVALLFGIWSVNLIPFRKDRPVLRIAVSVLLFCLTMSAALLIPPDKYEAPVLRSLYYYTVYLAIFLGILFCCDGSIFEAAYVAVIGQLWQHFLFSISSLFFCLLSSAGHPAAAESASAQVYVALFYAVAYLGMYLFLKGHYHKTIPLSGNIPVLLAAVLLPALLTVLNLLVTSLPAFALLPQVQLLYWIYCSLTCVISFLLLLSVHLTHFARAEAEMIRQSALLQKERYEVRKEAMEQVNIRAHDLKKLLARAEASSPLLDRAALEEIHRDLNRYDSLVSTGSDVLDTIISDAVDSCQAAGIRFTWLLDGSVLTFMDALDLYAIFGNLLDNAITAAREVKDPENRIISLKMKQTGNLCFFHLYNTYSHTVSFDGALPKTTRQDAHNHGFGMKSVLRSLKKYGGEMRVAAKDQVFNVNFMLKLP